LRPLGKPWPGFLIASLCPENPGDPFNQKKEKNHKQN